MAEWQKWQKWQKLQCKNLVLSHICFLIDTLIPNRQYADTLLMSSGPCFCPWNIMFSRLQIGTSNEKPISCQSGAAITSYHHTCAAAYHHEHGGVGSYSLVVEVNAHDGITPERLRPPKKSRTPAMKSFTKFAPIIVSPVTTPRYSHMGCPSSVGVVDNIIMQNL